MRADVEKTGIYYKKLKAEKLCSCGYCENYRLRVRRAYPEVAAFLATLGVEIEKAFETSPLEPDENGMLTYCACQYIVFGTCPETYVQQLGDVEFRRAQSYPDTGIGAEHFVLECYPITLKFE